MNFNIHKHSILQSTQRMLQNMPDAREGCVVCTDFQTMGRGQQNATWESEAGKNLLFSLLVEPSALPAANAFDLSRTTALSIAHFLIEKGIDARIKWANDIFAEDKKIAGILIEPVIRDGRVRRAVVGIGLNINQLEFDTSRTTSMALVLKNMQNKNDCLNELLNKFNYYYNLLQNQQYQALRTDYTSLLYRKTGIHKYRAGGIIFAASIISVSDNGTLTLQKKNGSVSHYHFKEVEFVFENVLS